MSSEPLGAAVVLGARNLGGASGMSPDALVRQQDVVEAVRFRASKPRAA